MKDAIASRAELIAPCGLDCGICKLYLSKDSDQLAEALVCKGIPKEALPCTGCRNREGQCPVISGTCSTYECADQRGIAFCSECSDFPCARLAPAADRADSLPHNMKMYNLCMIDNKGIETLIEQSSETKQAYYKGRMAIGEGPRLGSVD